MDNLKSQRLIRRIRRALSWLMPIPCLVLPATLSLHFNTAAVSEHGTGSELWDLMSIEVTLVFLSLAALVAGIPLMFVRRTRRVAAIGFLCGLAFIVGLTSTAGKAWEIHRAAYQKVARRSHPLVEAIKAFEKEAGHPPETLGQLTPRFLPEIPSTGMGACPSFEFISGEKAQAYNGNPWVLQINPPQAGIGFDRFFYFPLQNYPETGYGGWLERIEDWAYVHE